LTQFPEVYPAIHILGIGWAPRNAATRNMPRPQPGICSSWNSLFVTLIFLETQQSELAPHDILLYYLDINIIKNDRLAYFSGVLQVKKNG
jgi:hypothetical protein